MAQRIEVASKVLDTRAASFKKKFQSISPKVNNVDLVDTYTIDKNFTRQELEKIAAALIDSLTQKASFSHDLTPAKFQYVLEIGYLPGVTDNAANTVKELIEDLLRLKFKGIESVYTSRKYFINGNLSHLDVEKIAASLYNPLIQRVAIKSFEEYQSAKDEIVVPRVELAEKEPVITVDLNVSDKELETLSVQGIIDPDGSTRGPLALPLIYMKAIQSHFKKLGTNPTDIELESLAQTWSEHCKHTIFRDPIDEVKEGLFKRYIRGATEKINKDFCLSVFTDNSGIIDFDEEYAITHKVETHNSPSALDPFGGAVTGIVGVNRDAIGAGLGAKPIINFYGFGLADPADKSVLYRDKELRSPMLSARRIMDGVIEGVNYGGNTSGIPTPQGFLHFNPRYRGKPLVFVGTVGLLPKKIGKRKGYEKKANPGDFIVMIGGRVGLDGIHGATFSSIGLDSKSPATAVQIGDPITQKKFSDALIRDIRDKNLYTSITDCGAGGLSSAVPEMAKQAGGCEVDIEKVPLKYPGLTPWQIWISESQERMVLSVPPKNWKKIEKIFQKRGIEATVIGKFTAIDQCVVRYEGKKIVDLEMDFLHEGLPPRPMKTRKPVAMGLASVPRHPSPLKYLLDLLKHPNFTSSEFIPDQYDHEVQGGSVLKPLQGKGRAVADATVTRPVLSSQKGVILSQALYPEYTEINPYQMIAVTIDTAIRNAVATGANLNHLALLDNFCWCSSDEAERLWQLKEAARACYDFAVAYGTPYISGKDSMFNDFKGYDEKGNPIKISIPPTLLISAIGVMNDVSKAVSLDFKSPGDLVYVLGETVDSVLEVDPKRNIKLYKAFTKAVEAKLVASSVSVHRGGVLFSLARSAIGGQLGVDFPEDGKFLYPEGQGRILISVSPQHQKAFEKTLEGNYFCLIGKVRSDQKFLNTTVDEITKSYKSTFKDF